MSGVLHFPHSAASPFAERAANNSASTSSVTSDSPCRDAAATTRGHHSAGMESRAFMVRACESGMPMAAPNLGGPPNASITEANESITQSLRQVSTQVNTARSDFTATICVMKRRETLEQRQGNKLAEARKMAGYRSARDAALKNGWPESTYRAHENGGRTIGRDDAERYIRVFRAQGAKITPQSVLFPDRTETDPFALGYKEGWEAAMRAVAEAASRGTIPPAPSPRSKKESA